MTERRTIPFSKPTEVQANLRKTADALTLPFSDPGQVREMYLDHDRDEFGNIIEPCDKSPTGQCEYKLKDRFQFCAWCGKESGL